MILNFEETELVDFFNYMKEDWVISHLSEVVARFGYSGTLGHIWNMGFYEVAERSLSKWAKSFANERKVEVCTYRIQ